MQGAEHTICAGYAALYKAALDPPVQRWSGGLNSRLWSPQQYVLALEFTNIALIVLQTGTAYECVCFRAIGGLGLGPALAGWIEMNQNLQWRWIQYIP